MIDTIKHLFFATRQRSLVTIIGALILIGIIWLLFPKQATPQYQTAQAEKGTLITTVSSSGTISSGSVVSVTTSATGVVNAVYVKDGDTVTAGEKIADVTLDQSSLQKQSSAWASYLSAQANLDSAKSKMNSLQSALFKANQAFITDKGITNPTDQDKQDPKYIEENADWLQAEADYNNQQTVINAAQAAVTSSWYAYQQVSSAITAPSDGTISGLSISEGYPLVNQSSSSSTNNTSSAQAVASITLPSGSLQASVNLSEIDVTKVHVGQKVELTLDAFPDKTFTGKISSINTTGSVSSGVTTYPAVITFDTTDSTIYPNMAINAKIITLVKDDVLMIPSTAIQSANGQTTVRVLKNGKVQPIAVETGDANDTETEITSGLSEGDTVITSITSTTQSSGATSSPFGGGGFGGGNRVFFNGGGGGVRRGG